MTPLVRLWIWIAAFASLAGWTLSALGQLNRPGYAAALGIFALFIFFRRKDLAFGSAKNFFRLKKILRRHRRPLPLAFALLAVLIFFGGVLYPPSNYTALTYHIPRVLHWLAEGRWHWIHTTDNRMNYSGCDFEWLFTPLLLFARSDRAIFLLNFIPFILLPGLVFSVFTRLGVRARVAWPWMWLLPAGYTFLLQAGSAANDAVSAVFALAAVDFGCRAWSSRQPRDLWHSLLALALMVGTKPTSLPLLLPWTILTFALLPMLRQKFWLTALIASLALAVSFFPVALMNAHYAGDWLGASLDNPRLHSQNLLVGIGGNAFELLVDNFVPPLFPLADWYNQHIPVILPPAWPLNFQDGFFHIWELPTEDWSGVGFGISLLALVSTMAALFGKGRAAATKLPGMVRRLVLVTPYVALLAYCAKAGMATPSRLIAPYYPLLLPLLLTASGQSQIVRRKWWRGLSFGVMALAFIVLIVSPDRPLWPAKTILGRLAAQHPQNHLLARGLEVYTVYGQRADSLASVREQIPRGLPAVGFIGTPDDCDFSFWLPLGQRRVEHFLLGDPPGQIRQAGIEYLVISGEQLQQSGMPLDGWLKKTGAELIATTNVTLKISDGPQPWFLVRLKP